MARPLRIQFAGAWYHVMNRGAGRRIIFADDRHRNRFLDLLGDIRERYRVEVHAWCLMGNHYHLLIRTQLPNLARAMRHLDGVYTQWHNRVHETDGALFRGRYKSIVVDSGSYLAQLSRYIHRNPVDAKLTPHIENWRWSSYRAYIGLAQRADCDWLCKNEILGLFGSHHPHRHYRAFVELGVDDEIREFYGGDRIPPVLGSAPFREKLRRLAEEIDSSEIPEQKRLRKTPDLESIIAATAEAFGLAPEAVTNGQRGQTNVPRAIAMRFCRSPGGYPLAVIAKAFGLRSYTSVAMAAQRVQPKLDDPKLRAIVERLERRLFGVV